MKDLVLREKIAKAILRNEETIVLNDVTYNLPSPQRCGTETQKFTYANLKAIEIMNQLDTTETDEVPTRVLNLITPTKVIRIGYGKEIPLSDGYVLYKYSEEDIVVVIKQDEWEEVLQVIVDGNKIEFESLK